MGSIARDFGSTLNSRHDGATTMNQVLRKAMQRSDDYVIEMDYPTVKAIERTVW